MLYLFSSNIRPLYSQDILDLLAAPRGSLYTFRYTQSYINDQARSGWRSLAGEPVLVHFSMQQEARYHDPVFFPVRRGRVHNTWVEDTLHFVCFKVEGYVSLADPKLAGNKRFVAESLGKDPQELKATEVLAFYAKKYRDLLVSAGVDCPYDYSASLNETDLTAEEATQLQVSSLDTKAFQDITRYLTRTDTFRSATFLRFLDLRAGERTVEPDEGGVFELNGGVTYHLRVLQSQPADVRDCYQYEVSADHELLTVIGRTRLEIASPYDVLDIPIHAQYPGSQESLETTLAISPEQGVQGPTLRLQFRVKPSEKRYLAALGSFVALVVFGAPNLIEKPPLVVTALALVFGAAVLSLIWLFNPGGRPPPSPRV